VLVLAAWSLVHGLASLWLDGPLRKSAEGQARGADALSAEVSSLLARLFADAGKVANRRRRQ
jgi:hypothetical protein